MAAGSTLEVAGETATSTPSPALQGPNETEVAGEADAVSPPPPEKVEDTAAASPDRPADVAEAEAPEQEGEAEGESPTAPDDEPENPEETAAACPEPPAEEEVSESCDLVHGFLLTLPWTKHRLESWCIYCRTPSFAAIFPFFTTYSPKYIRSTCFPVD